MCCNGGGSRSGSWSEDSMYSFLTFLRDTQDKKLLEKVSINYTGIIQDS